MKKIKQIIGQFLDKTQRKGQAKLGKIKNKENVKKKRVRCVGCNQCFLISFSKGSQVKQLGKSKLAKRMVLTRLGKVR